MCSIFFVWKWIGSWQSQRHSQPFLPDVHMLHQTCKNVLLLSQTTVCAREMWALQFWIFTEPAHLWEAVKHRSTQLAGHWACMATPDYSSELCCKSLVYPASWVHLLATVVAAKSGTYQATDRKPSKPNSTWRQARAALLPFPKKSHQEACTNLQSQASRPKMVRSKDSKGF